MTVEVDDSIFWFALDQMRFSLFFLPFFPILYTAMSDLEFPDFTFSDTFGVSFSHLLILSVLSCFVLSGVAAWPHFEAIGFTEIAFAEVASSRSRGGSSASSTFCTSPSSSRAATS